MIDLMQGQLNDAQQLKEDEVLTTILQILCPSVPAPTRGYYYAGVLQPELQLLENVIYTRWRSNNNRHGEDNHDQDIDASSKLVANSKFKLQLDIFNNSIIQHFLVMPFVSICFILTLQKVLIIFEVICYSFT